MSINHAQPTRFFLRMLLDVEMRLQAELVF